MTTHAIKAARRAPTVVAYRELLFASYSKTEAPRHYSTTTCPRAHRPKPLAVYEPVNFLHNRTVSRSYVTNSACPSPTQSGVAPLPHRRLVSVAGPDAAKFLQGLLTNNVEPARLSPFYAAFLDARGRVLWDVFVWVWPELVAERGHWSCYIEADANEVESLKKHLKKHKLRSKVDLKDVATEGPEGLRVWAAWGEAHEHVQQDRDITGFKDPRANDLYRYLAKAGREIVTVSTLQVEPNFYHVHRYMQGVAEGAAEIPRENALPMEYNIDLSGGIDFKKGCYVGQELTIRTKHTGVVRKRVLPVQLHNTTPTGASEESSQIFCNGADIKPLDESGQLKKGRPTGKLISSIGNVGLALCRLENMTPVRVSAEGGTFKNGTEFGVELGDSIIKVAPVLHPWFLKKKETLWDTKKSTRDQNTVATATK